MAANRLYIVNTETKEYICIAKMLSEGWSLGNADLLKQFLGEIIEPGKTALIIGTENDDKFYNTHIADGVNVNSTNKWEYE